jgi:hypothetical protein
LSSRALSNPIPSAFWAPTESCLSERIFRGGIEARHSCTIHVARATAETTGTSIATKGRLTSPMCAQRDFASTSGARNSRLSCQASGCAGYHRRHPSLVGARRMRQKMGADNCRDRRATRRTRFSRTKAICGWQNILPRLPALSREASATATTKLYS